MKKLLILLLLLTMVPFSLFACGSEDEKDDGKYNIKFIVNGVEVASVETDGKSLVTLPNDPSRTGYKFDGWFWDKDEWNSPFTADYFVKTPLTSSIDVKVYAKFTEDSSGGSTGFPGVGGGDTYYDPDGWTDPEK